MNSIQIKDKRFNLFLTESEIKQQTARLAEALNRDYAGLNPLFLSVLNGAFMFTADLMRLVTIPSEVSFVKFSSYSCDASTGKVKSLVGLGDNVASRHIVVVEDIIDTGLTMQFMLEQLAPYHPLSVKLATLLLKPDKLKVTLPIDYVGFRIPNDFIVGYGMDYDEQGRNLPDIYTVNN